MKRSGSLKQKKPLAPGKGFQRRTTAMSRGTSTLTSKKPIERGQATLARSTTPMAAVGQRAKRTGQGRVPPTAAERAWMNQVAQFGCIVCWLQHKVKTPAAVHHILAGGRRMGHLYTIPLCDPGHHQNGDKVGNMISRHPWKARFEAAYGTELELLAELRTLLAWDEDSPSSVSVAPRLV